MGTPVWDPSRIGNIPLEPDGESVDNGIVFLAAPTYRRQIFLAIKLLILGTVVWWVWHSLRTSADQLDQSDWESDPAWLAFAASWYLAGLLPAGLFWHRILLSLGQRPRWGATLRAYYIGHLGKYVPGKAWVIILRSGLLAQQGVRAMPAVVSVFIETLTMMAVGAALAAASAAILFPNRTGVVVGGVCLMLVAGAPTLPPILNRIFRVHGIRILLAPRPKLPDTSRTPETMPDPPFPRISWRLAIAGWIMNSAGWILIGLSLWAVLRSLGPADQAPLSALPHYTAAVALAMVAGFLSGLPGGIGVRDGILILILTEIVPEDTALVAAVLLRIIWLVAEIVISGILYLGGLPLKSTPLKPHPNGS